MAGFIAKTKMVIPGLKSQIPVSILHISNLLMPITDLKFSIIVFQVATGNSLMAIPVSKSGIPDYKWAI